MGKIPILHAREVRGRGGGRRGAWRGESKGVKVFRQVEERPRSVVFTANRTTTDHDIIDRNTQRVSEDEKLPGRGYRLLANMIYDILRQEEDEMEQAKRKRDGTGCLKSFV